MNRVKNADMQLLDIQTILAKNIQHLAFLESSHLDAEILLCFVLQVNRTYLYTHKTQILNQEQILNYQNLISRRAKGEPLAYLTGYKAFWSFDVQVTESTLIPRPETELLVEQALARLPLKFSGYVIDLGTGSGAIALAIAKERPQYQILATDISINALTVAQANAHRLNIENIQFLASAWYAALGKMQANIIISNPPYVAENDRHLFGDGVQYEPRGALVSDNNGLADLAHIIVEAKCYLVENGWLLVEHGYAQASAVQKYFKKQAFSNIETYRDLAGLPRVTVGQKIM